MAQALPPPMAPLSRRSFPLIPVVAYVLLALWSLGAVLPIAWVFASAFKPARDVFALPPKLIFEPTLENFRDVLGLPAPDEQLAPRPSTFPRNLLNSTVVSLGTLLVALPMGALAGYGLARFRIPGKRVILMGIIASILIPPIVLLVPIYTIWRRLGLLDTHAGLVLAYTTFALPFVIWVMRSFFLEIPVDLEEAALVDGCTRVRAFWQIVLPLAAPGLATVSVFLIIFTWNEFLLASILTGRQAMTISPAILGYVTDKAILWGKLYAASSLVLLPVIAFTLTAQRYLAAGLTGGAVKG